MSRIQVSPEIHFGKPCVAGTRIPVQAVLELVREAIPFESIIRDYYPDLKMEDIQACVHWRGNWRHAHATTLAAILCNYVGSTLDRRERIRRKISRPLIVSNH
jgi:uncharacterized protein (DUF433 family)